ncbi:hypothetical protein [Spartinivicinus poritis]|uniref:Peptidase MA-like domain-containing protein n=1 Tax=Spartinivicinus poritis TaxID=2994640 RepID=A0ABT5UCB4_9GAMM|nr:hypothetical protein [Spartinivicinus sp. A2-2]MDE1464020.1 hypothetical protein [Spartinivicinus sp. A2-2]
MKKSVIGFTAIIFLLESVVCIASSDITYRVNVEKENPTIAKVSADVLTLGNFVIEPPQASNLSTSHTKLNVICQAGKGKNISIQFGVPIQCKSIHWNIKFKKLSHTNFEASSLQNIYSPIGWWVLHEQDSLPRISGNHSIYVCVTKNNCNKLPENISGNSGPPVFMVWGKKTGVIKIHNFKINIFSDKELLYSKIPSIKEELEKQYSYLSAVFLSDKQQITWSLVWIAIDQKYNHLSGAAGANAYITNYLVDNGRLTDRTLPWLLRVSAHETVHVLSKYTLPTWINESLAEYYAFKTLTLSNIETRDPIQEWLKRKSAISHASSGLYHANRMVSEQHDMSFYPLFYLKGAALWQELDIALNEEGKNLDQYIRLLNKDDSHDPTINQSFIQSMVRELGSGLWESISSKYL